MSVPPSLATVPSLLLFGGTFDPVHNAHLKIARAAADLRSFAKVFFIPAANPPHKTQGPFASFEHRVRMLEIACAVDPRFEVSRIEEGTARSYSIDTIEKLQHLGPLAFLIGADAFAEVETWHRWRDVIGAVEFVVVPRPGSTYTIPPQARVTEVPHMDLRESSSDIRQMIAQGSGDIPVPAAVLAYIRKQRLYGSHDNEISQTHSVPST